MKATKHQIQSTRKPQKQFRANIIIGRKSMDCAQFGICRIEPQASSHTDKQFADNRSSALITCISKDNLLIEFQRINMTIRTKKKYFSLGRFLLMEDYRLPKCITDCFELPRTVIPKGKYQIHHRDKVFDVKFKLIQY